MRRCPQCGTPTLGDYPVKAFSLKQIAKIAGVPIRTAQDWRTKGRFEADLIDPPVEPKALYSLAVAFKVRLIRELRSRPLPDGFDIRITRRPAIADWLSDPRQVADMGIKQFLVTVPKESAPKGINRPHDICYVLSETKLEEAGFEKNEFLVDLTQLAAEVVAEADKELESKGVDPSAWSPWI